MTALPDMAMRSLDATWDRARWDVLVYSQPDHALGDYAQSNRAALGAELISPTLPLRATVDGFFADAPDMTLY